MTSPPEWPESRQEQGQWHQHQYLQCKQQGRYADALYHAQQAVQYTPDRFHAWGNLANIQRDLQDFARAEHSYQQALRRCADPQSRAQLRFNWALSQLTQGNYTQGWQGFLAKFAGGHERSAPDALQGLPRWQGESLVGKRVLVQALEGFGDCLQWLRFLPLLRQATGCGPVGVCSHPELSPLLLPPEARAYSPLHQVSLYVDAQLALAQQDFDLWLPLYALPHLCRAQLEHLPAPWERLFPAAVALLSASQPADTGRRRIGLVWQVNPLAPTARRRNLPFAQLVSLLQTLYAADPQVQFYSFQYHLSAAEETDLQRVAVQLPLTDLRPQLLDFAHTAGLLQQMDVLITVDTVMAHLGAALRVPTHLLLSYVADWRWLTAVYRESPWYPAERSDFRLFRQTEPGNWQTVCDQVVYTELKST